MRYSRILLQPLSRHLTRISQTHHHFHTSPCDSTSSKYFSRYPNFRDNVRVRPIDFNFARGFTSSAQEPKPPPSERVSEIVNEITGLTLLEMADLVEVLRKKMDIKEMPGMAFMMPGMGFGVKGGAKGGGAAKEEKKAEKTAFDLKLEGGFDASVKIKIIKEVRACTDLGLKEAKDLVEKAPTLLKKGVPKEEAEKIIAKMKEVGAKVIME